ncbi:MAG: hypothetical protein VX617_02665, partial [Pseudomonadota bacterium]|nr:hypothetical protein [Pseudomonadota bacterium]
DTSNQPQDLLKKKVRAGELGMTVGKGFHTWTQKEAKLVKKRLINFLIENMKKTNITNNDL